MRNHTHTQRSDFTALAPASPGQLPAVDLGAVARALTFAVNAVIERLRRARDRAAQRAAARETYLRLRELDTRTLRDLGFHRSELYSLALETHGEIEATRRLRGRAPDFPSNLSNHDQGAPNEFRF